MIFCLILVMEEEELLLKTKCYIWFSLFLSLGHFLVKNGILTIVALI